MGTALKPVASIIHPFTATDDHIWTGLSQVGNGVAF